MEKKVMESRDAVLTEDDIDILKHNINEAVRVDPAEDAEVKRLFKIYQQL